MTSTFSSLYSASKNTAADKQGSSGIRFLHSISLLHNRPSSSYLGITICTVAAYLSGIVFTLTSNSISDSFSSLFKAESKSRILDSYSSISFLNSDFLSNRKVLIFSLQS